MLSPEYPRAQGFATSPQSQRSPGFEEAYRGLTTGFMGKLELMVGSTTFGAVVTSSRGEFRVPFTLWCASKVTRRFHSNWDPVYITNTILPNCQRIANVSLNRMTLSSFGLRSSSFFCSGVSWGPNGSQGRSMLTMELIMHAAGCLSPRPSIMFPQ